jgi:site-specific recombinase XerD
MVERASPTLPTLVQHFFIHHLKEQRAVSAQTIAAYRDTLRLFLSYAAKVLNRTPSAITLPELDAPLLLAFLDHLEKDRGNSVRSRNARLAAIRTFLKFASHHDLASLATIEQALAIPFKRFDRPLVGFLSRSEIGAIIEAPDRASRAGQRDRAFFSMMYNTGARVSEMIGIRCRDIVLEGQPAVHLRGKGRKERSVPLWRPTAALIRSWLPQIGDPAGDSVLFPNRNGGRMSRSNVTQRLGLAVAAASCNNPGLLERAVTPHTFRHTTAMHLLQSGVDITVIALWLGHEDTATTHMYVEADLAMKEQALMKLQPSTAAPGRFRASDSLLSFLQSL